HVHILNKWGLSNMGLFNIFLCNFIHPLSKILPLSCIKLFSKATLGIVVRHALFLLKTNLVCSLLLVAISHIVLCSNLLTCPTYKILRFFACRFRYPLVYLTGFLGT